MKTMRDYTYNKATLLTRALAVVENEGYKKWLEAELMRTLGYKGQSVAPEKKKTQGWT